MLYKPEHPPAPLHDLFAARMPGSDIERLRLRARVSFLRQLGAQVANLFSLWRASRAKRKSLIHLSELEDWQLDDIGLTRADVQEALADAGIYRDTAHPIQPH
ncbi:DUF1127 domain-containing protein [Pelagibacterium lentulum]|uniref:YjiS-like domain-containing protein n=1 Tax=Pelagibacterium lentulum TaxID=2029865 RepID=A0A916RCL0_9HYPH|nr:DUF1127 domain-containing protein [Pelagibacterium lentulum]GGA50477.1 hypothetical protein GCM10011499_20530 [Pelagibacterium lentulum]